MKKIIPLVAGILLLVPALSFVHAEEAKKEVQEQAVQGSQPVMATLQNPLKVSSLGDLYNSILEIVVEIGYVLVALFLLLAGFKFVTAQGSESKLEDAKKTFYYTIIGALIVIGARTIFAILRGVISGLTK